MFLHYENFFEHQYFDNFLFILLCCLFLEFYYIVLRLLELTNIQTFS